MSQIILDMGSGNTCRNSIDCAKRMIDAVVSLDSKKHEVLFKWQLENVDPPGQKKLDPEVFRAAYQYAESKGYQTTSSVFDKESLMFLYQFRVPFIKIACQPKLYKPIGGLIPRMIPVYMSANPKEEHPIYPPAVILCCIPEYPAKLSDYPPGRQAYSDHTPGLELWNYYHPPIWEKHFVLERTKGNPDSGVFAITPDQLKEVIG
jgi:sialic acid synthase SpsE